MRFAGSRIYPEITIAGAMLALMMVLASWYRLPVVIPSGDSAAFVGIHYIYPLIATAVLGVITFLVGKREVATRFMIAAPCYSVVLFVHFNIKLWIPHINRTTYDGIYWNIDQMLHPFVWMCMGLRNSLTGIISFETNFYMISYIIMFYCSFLYHAAKTPDIFAKLTISVLLLQALGTFAYLLAPAVGPFIHEAGVNPLISQAQHGMLEFYHNSMAFGPHWLAGQGANFTAGLAAMPSLHAAGAFLFFLFAWKHGKALLPIYAFILPYILVTAIANRWHYVIDLPVGMALAWVSYWLADRLSQESSFEPAAIGEAVPQAA